MAKAKNQKNGSIYRIWDKEEKKYISSTTGKSMWQGFPTAALKGCGGRDALNNPRFEVHELEMMIVKKYRPNKKVIGPEFVKLEDE